MASERIKDNDAISAQLSVLQPGTSINLQYAISRMRRVPGSLLFEFESYSEIHESLVIVGKDATGVPSLCSIQRCTGSILKCVCLTCNSTTFCASGDAYELLYVLPNQTVSQQHIHIRASHIKPFDTTDIREIRMSYNPSLLFEELPIITIESDYIGPPR